MEISVIAKAKFNRSDAFDIGIGAGRDFAFGLSGYRRV